MTSIKLLFMGREWVFNYYSKIEHYSKLNMDKRTLCLVGGGGIYIKPYLFVFLKNIYFLKSCCITLKI